MSDFRPAEAVILVKAAPHVGRLHGETVCCAGIDPHGRWLRLYPVGFRHLEDAQKFGRWDQVSFRCRKPHDDARIESRRIDQQSLVIDGRVPQRERPRLVVNLIVTSLVREREKGRSLALLKPEIKDFIVESKPEEDLCEERARFAAASQQPDIFHTKQLIYEPSPYRFKYRYRDDDGDHEGTCQDWEIEATYFNWMRRYGHDCALEEIRRTFGETYPSQGMLLAMGTHSRRPDQWLINGVIRMDEIRQLALDL